METDKKEKNTQSEKSQSKKPMTQEELIASQCPCRLGTNIPNWCGVAGGGVPACIH